MSILSVDNISPIGSGTSVTVNSAATLVVNNVSVAGVSTFTGNVIVDNGTVRCNDGFSSDVDLIFNADANNNGTGSIIFKESGSQRARITSGGLVETASTFGIANVGGSIGGSGGLENWIGLKDSSGNYGLIMKTASQTAANVRNVGINTVSPTYGMHLHGTTASSNAYYYAEQSTAGASAGFRLKTTGSHFAIYGATSGSALGIYDYNAGAERLTITSGGDVLIADSTNSVYNDSSGGGINLKANGQIVTKKEATSVADPLVWLNDTGQTTNKFIVFAQDGSEKANIGLAGNSATVTVAGSERLRITSTGQTKLNITSNGALTEPLVIRNGGTGAGTDVGMIFYNGDESTTGAGTLAKIKAIDEGSYDGALVFETASKNGWSNTGTSERLRISSEGYVTTPDNVIFSANSGPSDVTNGILVFSNVVFQRGGTNYNTSTGVFTAPVTGIYHFMCNPYRYVDSDDSYIHLQRSTNSGSSWSNEIEVRAKSTGAAGWTTLALSNLIDLNAGWQVRIYCTNRVHTNATFTRFSGMLVG